MKQFLAFVRKEFHHIFRDRRTMLILLVMPVILIVLFGYAITTEIRMVPVTVFDQRPGELTTRIADHLGASGYFEMREAAGSESAARDMLRRGEVKMAVVLPAGLQEGRDRSVNLLVNASDPNEATQLSAYAGAIIRTALAEEAGVSQDGTAAGIVPVVQLLYNPQMKGAYNFVPGVMGLILILICAMMTSVGIVREKETGTMEVLLVSPLRPVWIVLAKAVPYLMLSMINIATILALAYFLLDVPIAGSLLLLVGISVLYAIVALCLGLLISTLADTQQTAMLLSGMALMLPVMLLSGMMFPVENMPRVLQWLSNIVPARWYITAVKDVMIKGTGIGAVLPEIAVLAGMALLLIVVSVKRFKIRLE